MMLAIQATHVNHKRCYLKTLYIIESIAERSGVAVATGVVLLISNTIHTTKAADFNTSFRENLQDACTTDPLGNNLSRVCRTILDGGGPVNSLAVVTAPGGSIIGRRLQSPIVAKEEKLQTGLGLNAYAMNTSEHFVQSDTLQLPPVGGTSPDLLFGLGRGSGVSVFLSTGAFALNHHNNKFEDGYEAQLPTVTVGADYRINDWLLAGLSFNYTNYDGTYDDGGGFDKHIFGPVVYATFLPFEGAFANVILGYARQENSNNRLASASSCGLPGQPGLPCSPDRPRRNFEGHTSADYSENQYTAGVLAGYDQPFGKLTIGPRLGIALSHEDVGNIKEEGDTGLELRYSNLNQTSVQSSLGVQASFTFETAYGIVMPQAAIAWVHEYANSDRNIDAQLVEAPTDAGFTFRREPPARDWATIGLGASAVLPNGLEPFVQFETIQGNENFVGYGGTAGVRFGF